MILLLDNYDSFTFNLYQMLGAFTDDIDVWRNDALTLKDVEKFAPSHIVISPGPGRPQDAGISESLIRHFAGKIPLLGVCLGHQAICEVFGAIITYAPVLVHGKASQVIVEPDSVLFAGFKSQREGSATGASSLVTEARVISAGRYHSLIADAATIPSELRITAQTAGLVMAVEHRTLPVFGLQFHPESILTPCGSTILANFLAVNK